MEPGSGLNRRLRLDPSRLGAAAGAAGAAILASMTGSGVAEARETRSEEPSRVHWQDDVCWRIFDSGLGQITDFEGELTRSFAPSDGLAIGRSK